MTSPKPDALDSLSLQQKQDLLRGLISQKASQKKAATHDDSAAAANVSADIPRHHYDFAEFPEYKKIGIGRNIADNSDIDFSYFSVHEETPCATTMIDGQQAINFTTYNYCGLNGDPRISHAARVAMEKYGTSASASRIVSGERPTHRELEAGLAKFLGTQASVTFVSGYLTNLSVLATLATHRDLIIHDQLAHNSLLTASVASPAQRISFAHNDMAALETLLKDKRSQYEKVFIVVEGLYSMDGTVVPLPELVELKKRYKAILFIDEAHSLGVLGKTGRGIAEQFAIPASEIDILMGTLSKTLAGCGGYLAGSQEMVDIMKYFGNGFVYSVGMPPPIAAASLKALEILEDEPNRVAKLNHNGQRFLDKARALGLNTGRSQGAAVVPVITGSSVRAGKLATELRRDGVHVQPIIYPAVEEALARLRFFITSQHTDEHIDEAVTKTARHLTTLADL